MHILECDFRLGPLQDLEVAINAGVNKLYVRNKDNPWFDGLFIIEYGDILYGALLVAAQAYLVGVVSDLNEVRMSKGRRKLDKISIYRAHEVTNNGYSIIELINSGANYFKHREEWGERWPSNLTTQTLTAYSITPTSDSPLSEICEIIIDQVEFESLSVLLSQWRKSFLARVIE